MSGNADRSAPSQPCDGGVGGSDGAAFIPNSASTLFATSHHNLQRCGVFALRAFLQELSANVAGERLWCKRRKRGIFAGKGATRGRLTEMLGVDDLFKGRHFDREIIILCVRWYLRFKLSFRDLVEMMAERGLSLAHTTIMRWIQRYVPEFEKRWNRFARQAGGSWRVDETYVKIKGRWTYLYRAVDKAGKTVDFLLRAKRDVAAAKAFFRRAFKTQGRLPHKITLDGYQASHRAAREFLAQHRRRTNQNSVVEILE